MAPERLAELLEKYINGSASPQENAELLQWHRGKAYQSAEFPDNEEETGDRIFKRIEQHILPVPLKRRNRSLWYASAAAVLLITGTYYLFRPVQQTTDLIAISRLQPVVPGGNKAILTLAGGKTIILNNVHTGQIALQSGSVVAKSAAGGITYQVNAATSGEAVGDNTLSTPNGGQFDVTLPDGSRVWLNAHSSLTYPTTFNGNERRVKLSGEAYFEVAKNPAKPFIVDADGKQLVTVLGTHFDIEAYADDERINTTLLEGSVRLTAGGKQLLMKPGQTVVNDLAGNLLTNPADIDEVMAWKNGLFVFNDENIKDVMKKVSRWYDVDISYQGDAAHKRLGGVIARNKSITELLDNITKTGGINYQIKGRRIVLMK